jgi:hypothetical protein
MKNKNMPIQAHLTGKAGEYRVMSELMLRGHHPAMPPIDNGADIILESGLRIQVKSSHLNRKKHASYPLGLYRFELMELGVRSKYQNMVRDWTKRCDYFVLWCINEDRFFIFPATKDRGVILITAKVEDRAAVIDVSAAKTMHANGVSMYRIAKEMGVSWPTVKAHLTGERSNTRATTLIREIVQYENRWDLLDVNSVKNLVESVDAVPAQEKI